MPQRFYFHDAAASATNPLPGTGAMLAFGTVDNSASGATTNRLMDGNIGSGQTSASLSTSATTGTQTNAFRRFCTPDLAAQSVSVSASTFAVQIGASESNA